MGSSPHSNKELHEQELKSAPTLEAHKAKESNVGKKVLISVLAILLVAAVAAVTWWVLKATAPDDTTKNTTPEVKTATPPTTNTPTAQKPTDTATTTGPVTQKTTSVTANTVKFTFSYPSNWTLVGDGTTMATLTAAQGSTSKSSLLISSIMSQSAGCGALISSRTIKHYEAAPIKGWTGNSFVGYYDTDGSAWCVMSAIAATKDAVFTVGQTADKLYLQGASNHPSIDLTGSSNSQVYAQSSQSFASEELAKKYIASAEYTELKQIIQSITVTK